MKRLYLAILLLLAVCLLLAIALPVLKQAALSKKSERAVAVLADCYRFVFAETMDKLATEQSSAMPATLNDVPGWIDYVNKAEPDAQALYKSIQWHPPSNPSEGDAIASIELPDARAVLLRGGSDFTVKK